jgi:hypothetical protein
MNMLRTFTVAAGMGLADMDNEERPNIFLKGLIERLLLPYKKRKLDDGVRGLGLVDEREVGESNNVDGDDSAGLTRGVLMEGNNNQDDNNRSVMKTAMICKSSS